MIAASVWSLLIPAIDQAEGSGMPGWLPVAGGFLLGILFLMAMDALLPPSACGRQSGRRCSPWKRTTLLVLAVTLHNIPEGMAVGLSFALAAQHAGNDPASMPPPWRWPSASAYRIFPEGAAISLPLRQEGLSAGKSFLYGPFPALWSPFSASWWSWQPVPSSP